MIQFPYRRLVPMACLLIAPFFTISAQQAYQSPSADLVKILDAPANPISSISPNHQRILVTVADPRTVTISDMADSAYYLAGNKIRANPDYRVENIGVRSGSVTSIDGRTVRSLDVPAGGRVGGTSWSADGDRLAYTTISNQNMALEILDPATGRARHVSAAGLSGKIRDLDW